MPRFVALGLVEVAKKLSSCPLHKLCHSGGGQLSQKMTDNDMGEGGPGRP